jgi:NTE family protein
MGMKPDQMMDEINKLKFSDIFDLSLSPLTNGAILRAKKMYKKLQTYLNDVTFDQLKKPFCCVATDLNTGKTVTLSGDKKVVDAVAASSSIPAIFRPVAIDEMILVDGGVKCRVPIEQVKNMGADVVVAVDVLGQENKTGDKLTTINVLLRAIDVADAELALFRKKVDKTPTLCDTIPRGDYCEFW